MNNGCGGPTIQAVCRQACRHRRREAAVKACGVLENMSRNTPANQNVCQAARSHGFQRCMLKGATSPVALSAALLQRVCRVPALSRRCSARRAGSSGA